MGDSGQLARVLSNFAHTLVRGYDVAEVLYSLSRSAAEILPTAGAGVSLADEEGVLFFVAASDDTVASMEAVQVRLREGACEEAYRSGAACVVPDVETAKVGWPRYAPEALARGFQGVAGLPMRVDDRIIGAINLYHTDELNLTEGDLEAAGVLAAVASGYVVNARELDKAVILAEQLQTALDSRVVIEQAKGMIAERTGLGVTEAFEVLRRYARSNGTKLRDVARLVVEGSIDLGTGSKARA